MASPIGRGSGTRQVKKCASSAKCVVEWCKMFPAQSLLAAIAKSMKMESLLAIKPKHPPRGILHVMGNDVQF